MARSLVVNIVGDASSLERALQKSQRSVKRFNHQVSGVGRGAVAGTGIFQSLGRSVAFASGAFLGGVGLTAAIKAAFDEMSNAQKVAAQTATVIKSTGAVAGVSAGHVDALATSLLNLSGVDDEAIKQSENLLLTFTNIRNVVGKNNDVFDQATKSALDLSIRFDRDLSSSTITLGKALQDPVRGLLALSRTGIQFDDSQKGLIKRLVESGKLLEAQKIILGEVRRQTEGAAAAYGQTLAGKLNIAKESILNMGGAIAESLLPMLTQAADELRLWLSDPKNQKRVVDDLSGAIRGMGDAFGYLASRIQKAKDWKGKVDSFFSAIHAGFLNKGLLDLGVKRPKEFRPFDQVKHALGLALQLPSGAARPGSAAAAIAAAAAAAKEARLARRKRLRQANEAARQEVLDRAEFGVERTTATKTLKDDLAALRHYNALLTRRIKGGHGTLELEREQFHVQMQIADVLKQQADLAKKTKKRLGVDVTRFQASARGQLVTAGTHGAGRGVVISGGVHLHGIQNVSQLENELTRRSKQRAHHRRGRR